MEPHRQAPNSSDEGVGVMRTLTVLVPALFVPAFVVIPLMLVVIFIFVERRRDG
jgi:hypothetical protein